MSVYGSNRQPPILPPVIFPVPAPNPGDYVRRRTGRGYVYRGGTPPISSQPLPPFFGGSVTGVPDTGPMDDLPPTPEQVAAAERMGIVTGPYEPGPFCFGLDQYICENIPPTVGALGLELPAQDICKAILNAICGIVVTIILLTLLGIAFYGLTSDA